MIDFQEMRRLIREEERLRWAVQKKRSRAERITASFSQAGGGGISTGDKVDNPVSLYAATKRPDRPEDCDGAELLRTIRFQDAPARGTFGQGSGETDHKQASLVEYFTW